MSFDSLFASLLIQRTYHEDKEFARGYDAGQHTRECKACREKFDQLMIIMNRVIDEVDAHRKQG